MKRLILVLAILLLLPILASAQSKSQITPEQTEAELFERQIDSFLKAKSFKCNFEKGNFAFWKNGKLQSEVTNEKFSIIFDSIDYKKKNARMIGRAGASDILVNLTVGGVTFVEITESGSYISTTINFPVELDKNLIGKYYSVHSRHISTIRSVVMSSQYYGQCEIWDTNQ